MRKVKRLSKGSTIAVISPSSGLPNMFPEIFELGLSNLKEVLGFNIVEYPTARMTRDELYRKPELRAKDINDAFKDDTVDGIICSIGGYESVRILEYLDVESILNNPKMIMGFSDASTFLTYLNNYGLITLHGPSVMAGLAQMKHLPESHTQHLKDILLGYNYPYTYRSYGCWTEGYKDWSNKDTIGQCQEFTTDHEGYQFLLGEAVREGELWGGCIEVLEFLKSTDYWPDKASWSNKILFLETSEDKPAPINVGFMLRNYGIQGILGNIQGLIIARPKDYTMEEKEELKQTVMDILTIEFGINDLPVVFNMDIGHTDPKLIMPLGCKVRIDPINKEVVLLESPFEE